MSPENKQDQLAVLTDEARQHIRYDGKQFWIRIANRWHISCQKHVDRHLRVTSHLTKSEARLVIEAIKYDQNTIDDPAWWQEVKWHRFTRGCTPYDMIGSIHFMKSGGTVVRKMSYEKYKLAVARIFPDQEPLESASVG